MGRYSSKPVGLAGLWLTVAICPLFFPAGAVATHSQYESVPAAAGLAGLSNDGSRMVITSSQQLSSADTDSQPDIYVRVAPDSTPVLLSTGSMGGNGAYPAYFGTMSEDARHVFFVTPEELVSADTDSSFDLYESFDGTTTLVSIGPTGGNGPYLASDFIHASADGTHVFFVTMESLVTEDQDTRQDLYERAGGVTRLVTTGPDGGNGPFDANCELQDDHSGSYWRCPFWVSRDGSAAVFPTKEALVAADTDTRWDFYKRSGGTTTLVSTGPNGGNGPYQMCGTAFPYCTPLLSADGSRVFFQTTEPLVSADTDTGCPDGFGGLTTCQDVYERSGGTTTLISTGPNGGNGSYHAELNAASEDGDRVLFSTSESLVAGDSNGQSDIYERRGGTTTQISKGPTGSGSSVFQKASFDGAHVLFTSSQRLTSADTDSAGDLYEWFNGTLTSLSSGPSLGNNNSYECCEPVSMSRNGEWVFFRTAEPLLSEDNDSCYGGPCPDIYESHGGALSIVTPDSVGWPVYVPYVSDDGGTIAYTTNSPYSTTTYRVRIGGTPSPSGYARPIAATSAIVRLVPAFKTCSSSNTTHAAPLAAPSCSPPQQASDYLTVGTPDSNFQPANMTGYLKLKVVGETPVNPANGDQADVQVTSQITDVRRKSDLGDYTGDLSYVIGLRITDRENGADLNQPATVVDVPLRIPHISCSATGDVSGSTCATSTTLDALMPGFVTERKRSVWELAQVQVFDGGADGDADTTGDNTLFLTQGLYAP
jgi:hypothetical protein